MGVYSPGLEIAGYLDFDFKCLNWCPIVVFNVNFHYYYWVWVVCLVFLELYFFVHSKC
jgi:hypothetical protein